MCNFHEPFYHDGTPVPSRGHVDDYFEEHGVCFGEGGFAADLHGEWGHECSLISQLPGPGMYTAGHSGCWHFYYDGEKTYYSEDELPHGMYWDDVSPWEGKKEGEPHFYVASQFWMGDRYLENFMVGDCVPQCLGCFNHAHEGCTCGKQRWCMDHSLIMKKKKEAGK